jgi:hypothetical protein
MKENTSRMKAHTNIHTSREVQIDYPRVWAGEDFAVSSFQDISTHG